MFRLTPTVAALLCLATIMAFAQPPVAQIGGNRWQPGGGRRSQFDRGGRGNFRPPNWRPQRRIPDRSEFPTWEINKRYQKDVFTFVRIQYDSYGPFGWWDRWDNDYPDGDWNFSYRLQELTAMEVSPDSKVLRFTDEELLDHPFAYLAGAQWITLSENEVEAVRRYLNNGGFLMFDDLWTPQGWEQVRTQMQRVFPNQQPKELTLDHPIFHMVYDLKQLPQVVDLRTWQQGYTYEPLHGETGGDVAPHFWAYHDKNGRMVALICHNNDLGDGWEREGENHEYFKQFSERFSYPMGINVITYAMTH